MVKEISIGTWIWLLYAGLFIIPCVLQVLCCFLIRKKALKCIPVYVIALGLVLSILFFLGVFGDVPLFDIEIHQVVGFIYMFLDGIAALGVGVAWGIYGITLLIRRKTSLQNPESPI